MSVQDESRRVSEAVHSSAKRRVGSGDEILCHRQELESKKINKE